MELNNNTVNKYVSVLSVLDTDLQEAIISELRKRIAQHKKREVLRGIGEAYKEMVRSEKEGENFQDAAEVLQELLVEIEHE